MTTVLAIRNCYPRMLIRILADQTGNQLRIRRAATVAAAMTCLMLAGCVSTSELADESVKANLAVEDAQNRIHLLNIVRAAYRRPMHFTAISQLSGTVTGTRPSLEVSGNVGADQLVDVATLKFGVQPNRPSYTVSVWDTAKFQRGISKSVDPLLLKFYLDQGWPAQLVLALFVREIEITTTTKSADGKDETTSRRTLSNYPENQTSFAAFLKELDALTGCGFEVKVKPNLKQIGPAMPATSVSSLEHLTGAAKEKFLVAESTSNPGSWSVNRVVYEAELVLGKNVEASESRFSEWAQNACAASVVVNAQQSAARPVHTSTESRLRNIQSPRFEAVILSSVKPMSNTESALKAAQVSVHFELRSPASMLYYLGELARAQQDPSNTVLGNIQIGKPGNREPIFLLKSSDSQPDVSAVSIHYGGRYYFVPAGSRGESDHAVHGRSMQAITLVSQLINMQKEGDDLPAVSTIRLIGP